MSELEPTKWWRVLDSDGKLWMETSSESEARREDHSGNTLERLYQKVEVTNEWRKESFEETQNS